jgi:hypothetical protein
MVVEQGRGQSSGAISRRQVLQSGGSLLAHMALPASSLELIQPEAILTAQQQVAAAETCLGSVLELAKAAGCLTNLPRVPLDSLYLFSGDDDSAEQITTEPHTSESLEGDSAKAAFDRARECEYFAKQLGEYAQNAPHIRQAREEAVKLLLFKRDQVLDSPMGVQILETLKEGCLALNKRSVEVITLELQALKAAPGVLSDEDYSEMLRKVSSLECRADQLMPETEQWRSVIDDIEEVAESTGDPDDDQLSTKLDLLIEEGRKSLDTQIFTSLGFSPAAGARFVRQFDDVAGDLFGLFFDDLRFDFGDLFPNGANVLNLKIDEWLRGITQVTRDECQQMGAALKRASKVTMPERVTATREEMQAIQLNETRSDREPSTPIGVEGEQITIRESEDSFLLLSGPHEVLPEGISAKLLNAAREHFGIEDPLECICQQSGIDTTGSASDPQKAFGLKVAEWEDGASKIVVAITVASQSIGDVSFRISESEEVQDCSLLKGDVLFLLVSPSETGTAVILKAGCPLTCIFNVEVFRQLGHNPAPKESQPNPPVAPNRRLG